MRMPELMETIEARFAGSYRKVTFAGPPMSEIFWFMVDDGNGLQFAVRWDHKHEGWRWPNEKILLRSS